MLPEEKNLLPRQLFSSPRDRKKIHSSWDMHSRSITHPNDAFLSLSPSITVYKEFRLPAAYMPPITRIKRLNPTFLKTTQVSCTCHFNRIQNRSLQAAYIKNRATIERTIMRRHY